MIAVKSSNVTEIGYAPEYRLLRVRFHNGSTYDYPDVSADRYAALMAAESKGRHLHEHFKGGVRLSGESEVMPNASTGISPTGRHNAMAAVSASAAATPRETFAEDDCCRARLIRADRAGLASWDCPKCGCVWKWRMVGEVKHWYVDEAIIVFRT